MPEIVNIQPNHTAYMAGDYLWIVGEVYNGTSNYLRFVEINVNIFNASGQLISTDSGYVSVDSLAPWTKGCFRIFVLSPGNWSSYAFDSLDYRSDAPLPPKLTIYGDSGTLDSNDWYTIIGFMRNDDSVLIDFAEAIATLYNAQGKVVECDYGYPSDYSLDPGQASSFKIWSFLRDSYADVTNYKLQADGY